MVVDQRSVAFFCLKTTTKSEAWTEWEAQTLERKRKEQPSSSHSRAKSLTLLSFFKKVEVEKGRSWPATAQEKGKGRKSSFPPKSLVLFQFKTTKLVPLIFLLLKKETDAVCLLNRVRLYHSLPLSFLKTIRNTKQLIEISKLWNFTSKWVEGISFIKPSTRKATPSCLKNKKTFHKPCKRTIWTFLFLSATNPTKLVLHFICG